MRCVGRSGRRFTNGEIGLPADSKGLPLDRLACAGMVRQRGLGGRLPSLVSNRGSVRLRLSLRRGGGGGRGFNPGQDGRGGGVRFERSFGGGLSGARGGARFAGQHLAVAGGFGVARSYARGGLRGTAAGAVWGFKEGPSLCRGCCFTISVRGNTLVHFLFPRG